MSESSLHYKITKFQINLNEARLNVRNVRTNEARLNVRNVRTTQASLESSLESSRRQAAGRQAGGKQAAAGAEKKSRLGRG